MQVPTPPRGFDERGCRGPALVCRATPCASVPSRRRAGSSWCRWPGCVRPGRATCRTRRTHDVLRPTCRSRPPHHSPKPPTCPPRPAAPSVCPASTRMGWGRRGVIEAVHAEGGPIRVSFLLHRPHRPPVHATRRRPAHDVPAAPAPGGHFDAEACPVPFESSRAPRADEFPGGVERFRAAAQKAREAGFDGVRLHSADGHLLDRIPARRHRHARRPPRSPRREPRPADARPRSP